MKKLWRKVLLLSVAIVIMALVVETYILGIINRKNAYNTSAVIVDQVIDVIEETDSAFLYGVVKNMPAYDGITIYVSFASSHEVIASSDALSIGKTLEEIGINPDSANLSTTSRGTSNISNFRCYYSYKQAGDYLVCTAYNTSSNLSNYASIMLIELIYLVFAAATIIFFFIKSFESDSEREAQFEILNALADSYYSMHVIDIEKDTFEEYSTNDFIREVSDNYSSAGETIRQSLIVNACEEDRDKIIEFTDISTIKERMTGKKNMAMDFRGKNKKWCRASFVTINSDENGTPTKVIYAIQDIDEDKKREESLLIKSNIDELTGCLNRRAYEEEIQSLSVNDEFAYVSIDVNGLKVINDTLGHAAGDELITGAALCMKKVMGKYGKIFRIGGDEFVVIMNIDFQTMNELRQQFAAHVSMWAGKKVQSLSTSCGYVHSREKKWRFMKTLTKEADSRMYKSKSEYYQSQGVDRRGQRDAHTALCNMYTKILKINLTDDTYVIVNANENELKPELGYSDVLSSWMVNFGTTGQIHPYNLTEYIEKTDINALREYFKQGNDMFSMTYQRKINGEYCRVILEIIPATDYSDDKQTCFLYVKSINC